jgi:hypothetical protein
LSRPDRRRAGRGTPACRWRSPGLELESQRVDPASELVNPTLKLGRVAPELVKAGAEAGLASLDLGQCLGRPPVRRLDLGLEGGATSLDLLLHPQQVSTESIEVLAEEGGGLRSTSREDGDRSGHCG